MEAVNLRIGMDADQWFAPKFTHQVFGDKEQIMGYEGLAIDITLSPKFLVPLIQISYSKKAPMFAPIDDIEAKLRDHYGTIYTDPVKFEQEVVQREQKQEKYGQKITSINSSTGAVYDLHKVNIREGDFTDKQFYLQSVLTWFIDGVSQIEVNNFWNYFLLYDQNSNIAGFISVYEAYKNALEFRTKVS
jgi:histone acetyltransferase 1